MGIYTRLYQPVVARVQEQLEAKGQVHGSQVRDFFIEHAAGKFAVDNHAEALLTELVEDGVLKVLEQAPTHSQAAFAGLAVSGTAYREAGWIPGYKEHFWYAQA